MTLINSKQLQKPVSGSFTGSFTGHFSGSIQGGQPNLIPVYNENRILTGSSIYNSGSFTAINHFSGPEDPNNPELLYINGEGVNTYNLLSAHGNSNRYLQINVQNYNNSTQASSDIVATADNGDSGSVYIDMGINSSGFTDVGNVGGQNDAYVYSYANDLYIGNASVGKKVVIFNGGFDTIANSKIFIHDQGTIGINTATYNALNPPSLQIDAPSSNTYNVVQIYGDTNNYSQLANTNRNGGLNASSDIVAYNDIDPDNQLAGYIDMGINSTNYLPNIYYPGSAGDAYLFTDSSRLLIGSVSSTGSVNLFVGGTSEALNNKLTLRYNNYHSLSGSLHISGGLEVTNNLVGFLEGTSSYSSYALTASYAMNGGGTNINTSSLATTGSNNFNGNQIITGSLDITSNLTVNGDITAQTLHVQAITSSVEFVTGSTHFGSVVSNTHQFTGSLNISGSLNINGTSYLASTSGTSGANGTSGTSGAQGSSGASGTSGTSGAQGTSGSSGNSGTSGSSGINGTSGTSGANGANGTSGSSGINGTSGSSGATGTSGTSGANGTSGTSGAAGTSGTRGTSGTSGVNGTSGTSGANGANGTSGTSGANGVNGTAGTSGNTGTSGTSGANGTSGSSGVGFSTINNAGLNRIIVSDGTVNAATASANLLYTSSVFTINSNVVSGENTLIVGLPANGGVGEGGQILLQASGGLYASASMLDNYQNKFRLLRGTNAGSDAFKLQIDLQTGQMQLPNYNSAGAFAGTAAGVLGFDTSGNIITTNTAAGTSGTSGVGTSGTSGANGTSGTSGANGTSGTSGAAGTSGTRGTSGTSGAAGTSGTSGINGTNGTSGIDGTSGISGTNGTAGTSGAQGTSGTSGLGFPYTGSALVTGSLVVTGSFTVNNGYLQIDRGNDPGTANTSSAYFFVTASAPYENGSLHYRNRGDLWEMHWLEEKVETGLIYGGVVSFSGSTIYVTPGAGLIANHNASTSSYGKATAQYYEFNSITASATFITSSQITYLSVNSNGTLLQSTTPFTSQQYNEQFPLGYLFCLTTASISSFADARTTTYGSGEQQNQFIRAFGPLKLSGYDIIPQSGSLKISIGSGRTYRYGGFYKQNPDEPSIYDSTTVATGSILKIYRDPANPGGYRVVGGVLGGPTSSLEPSKWDDGSGTLQSVGAGEWTIQRVFQGSTTNLSFVYYGQNKYTSFASAVQSINTDSFVESPTSAISLTFIGYIIAEGNTTDLSDSNSNRIIQAGLFRNTAGSSGGGAITTQNLNDLNDVVISSPSTGQSLVYNAGNWVNGVATSSSYALTSSYTPTALTSSYAFTASYALNAGSSIVTGSYNLVSGSQDIITNSTGSNSSAFYNYVLTSGSNARAGQIFAVWNGSNIIHTDISTIDIGNTSGIVFTSSLSGGNYIISTSPSTSGWVLKTLLNLL